MRDLNEILADLEEVGAGEDVGRGAILFAGDVDVEDEGEDEGEDDGGSMDLDLLLAESVALRSAHVAKAQGRKLSAEQRAAVMAHDLAEREAQFLTLGHIAHFRHEECACGRVCVIFAGWYRHEQHRRRAGFQQLTRVQEPLGTSPQYRYTTARRVTSCPICLSGGMLRRVTTAQIPLLKELGECAEQVNTLQIPLPLTYMGGEITEEHF